MSEEKCVMCDEAIPEGRMVCPQCETIEPSFNTIKVLIRLDKITDISEFSRLAAKCRDDVIVRSGNFAVDAKSLMGLYSLDLTKILQVEFYGNVPNEVQENIQKFTIN